MRCRCCDKSNASYVKKWEEYYCPKCRLVIEKTTGENFGLDDLYRIIIGEDDPYENSSDLP